MLIEAKHVETVLSNLGESACLQAVAPFWNDSLDSFPSPPMPLFLDGRRIRDNREWCGFDASIEPLLYETAGRIAGDLNLLLLAWHCHQTVFRHGQKPALAQWPSLEHALGKEMCGVFYLLVALDLAPQMKHVHAGWGIPEQVTRDTCRQVFLFCHLYQLAFEGHNGVLKNDIGWLRNYMNGSRYFRLGRLELWLKKQTGDVTVFRRDQTTDVLALQRILPYLTKADFFTEGPVIENPAQNRAPAAVDETSGVLYEGYPLSPFGYGLDTKVRLSPEAWRPVFSPGDLMLDVHIPAGGGMTAAACHDSFIQAATFFRTYFPSEVPVAFCCQSWIFNTQFERLLSSDSNLVRFMRDLYLIPLQSKGNEGIANIFAMNTFDPQTSPRRTTLQRTVAEFLEKGGRLRQGGMFFLMEDLPHYGNQFYRRTWNPAHWQLSA